VCQSQASSAATSETVRPPPTWTVAHLAARVVSRQCLAAIRWSSSTQVLFGHLWSTQRKRCFFQAQRHRHPVDGQVDIVHDRAFFDLGRLIAARAAHVADDLFDHQLAIATAALEPHDLDVFETHLRREDLSMVDQDEGASCFLGHTTSLKRLRLFLGDGQRHLPAEIRRSTNTVVWILAGSCVSPPDDDRTEHTPVGLAGVEQGTDPVVLEVAEAEADPFDPLDQVVELRSVR
jgi:hypothetical protein